MTHLDHTHDTSATSWVESAQFVARMALLLQ